MLDLIISRPDAKFVWAEVYFLARYLQEYPERKPQVISSIQKKQFEIVGGGWVQHDEATVDFEMALRQTEAGFEYISRELGVEKVKIGWQMDPFGHSSITPALFEKMGLEVLVFSRIEDSFRVFYIKIQLQNSSNLEFIWKTQGLGSKTGIFTHVLNDHYYSPGFLTQLPWEKQCYGQLPANDTGVYNCIQEIEKYVNSSSYKYKTSHHLMLIGADFYFTDKNFTFDFIDLLSKISELSTNFTIKLSTASEYFDAVLSTNTTFQVYSGDILPLVSPGFRNKPRYWWKAWTGFYSTKPYIKKMIYDGQKIVRFGEIIKTSWKNEKIMAYEINLGTHHDAITGTMREFVYEDYIIRLDKDIRMFFDEIGYIINDIMRLEYKKDTGDVVIPYKVVFAINPINWSVVKTLSFETWGKFVKVFDTNGVVFKTQVVPFIGNYKVYFVCRLKGLEVKTLFIEEYTYMCNGCSEISNKTKDQEIGNEFIGLGLDRGLLTSLKKGKNEYFIAGRIVRYNSYMSGYYSFTQTEPAEIIGRLIRYNCFKGSVVDIAESEFSYKQEIFIQRIIVDKISDNFVMKFYVYAERDTDIFYRFYQIYDRTGWFYTFNTANIQKRYFEHNTVNKTGHNYYPITGGLIVDLNKQFMYVIPTFAVGAGMPYENVFEINLHRHPSYDDGFGVGEYAGDKYPVEHEWLIGFSNLNYHNIWKHFIEHRSSPILLFSMSNNSLTTNYKQSSDYITPYNYKNSHIFLNENTCGYLSSLVSRNNFYIFRILNICNYPIKIEFIENFEEINAGGLPLYNPKVLLEKGFIEFKTYNNSGKNVLDYPDKDFVDGIKPFELKTYKVKAFGVMRQDIMIEKIVEYDDDDEKLYFFILCFGACLACFLVFFAVMKKVRKVFRLRENKELKKA
ncbi:hypothetical protein SteCoe_18483 [Stentor coeruleus]|uniref:Glycoside hydrolase family 38 central domain-containing protein n=1 Tax=Stentor coeruleus TaxID=5963 RepID=A0A1R2BWP2_9CILI|nr:hypothetical protein SteCoe_18483 [Stentor coeruleus]